LVQNQALLSFQNALFYKKLVYQNALFYAIVGKLWGDTQPNLRFFCRFGEMSAYFVGIVWRETGLPVATFQK